MALYQIWRIPKNYSVGAKDNLMTAMKNKFMVIKEVEKLFVNDGSISNVNYNSNDYNKVKIVRLIVILVTKMS